MLLHASAFPILLVAMLIGGTAFADETPRKPNILWIFAEDLSPFMGCYDDPINAGHTPTIDKLASGGVLFKRAYMPAPVCSACRSAIITGVMQTTTGTHQHRSSRFDDIVPEEVRIHLPEGMKTIPEQMRNAGYFTFNSGKDDYNFHYDRRSLYTVGSSPDYRVGMNGWQGNRAEHALSITEGTWNAREDKDQPWFGQIEIKGGKANAKYVRDGEKLADKDVPLPPYFPDTPGHRKSWTMHYNAARGADARVEAILNQLRDDGELDNTIVFFFSDHGSNHSLRHKQFCYEGGVHVPLIIMGDHPALAAGTIRDDIVAGLDISATTLALAGAELPIHLDGQNLFGGQYEPAEYVISARDRCDYTIDRIRTVRSDKFRYIRNYFPDRPMLQAQYRDGKTEVKDLKRLHDSGELTPYQDEHWFGVRPLEELYDLATDPHQINNLASDAAFSDTLLKHRTVLESWIKRTDDQGQHPESSVQLKATYDLWKDRPVFADAEINPEYDQFRGAANRRTGFQPVDSTQDRLEAYPTKKAKPNIVLLFVDDLGWGDLGYRKPRFETPNIDRLAAESLDFQQAYIATPTCSPSRATLLTGKHPARLQLVRHIPSEPKHGFDKFGRTETEFNQWETDPAKFPCRNWLPLEHTTYAEALKAQGYYNQFVGKWHLGHEPYHPIHQGFDNQYGTTNFGHPKSYNAPFFENTDVFANVKDRHLTDMLTDKAVDFISSHDAQQPFMLSMWYYGVHGPPQGRPDLVKYFTNKGYDREEAVYAAQVKAVDESVGRIRSALKDRKLSDDTIVMFVSDQGGMYPNEPLRGGKKFDTLCEGGARVPLMIHWPGVTQPNTKCETPVQTTDLFPTLVEIAGGDPSTHPNLDGVSLMPILQGETSLQRDVPLFGYRAYEDLYASVRDGDWKLLAYRSGKTSLYNIAGDISESNDMASKHPDLVQDLTDKLIEWEQKMNVQQYSGVQ